MERETIKKLALCKVVEKLMGGDMDSYMEQAVDDDISLDAYEEWQESTEGENFMDHKLQRDITDVENKVLEFFKTLE